jgi:uncharacterized membrane protein HdeD (DUF308 family)
VNVSEGNCVSRELHSFLVFLLYKFLNLYPILMKFWGAVIIRVWLTVESIVRIMISLYDLPIKKHVNMCSADCRLGLP